MCMSPLRTPSVEGTISSRDSVEIQSRQNLMTVGLDLESLFDTFSSPNGKTRYATMDSRLGFESGKFTASMEPIAKLEPFEGVYCSAS